MSRTGMNPGMSRLSGARSAGAASGASPWSGRIVDHVQGIQGTLGGLAGGFSLTRWLGASPLLLAGGAILTLVLGRGRVLRTLGTGAAMLGLLRRYRKTFQFVGQVVSELADASVGQAIPVAQRREPAHPQRTDGQCPDATNDDCRHGANQCRHGARLELAQLV